MILSLKAELGNNFALIAARLNEMFETEWSNNIVRHRFLRLEKEEKQGGRKRRRVDWDDKADNQLLAFRDEWMEKSDHSKSILSRTQGMWPAMAIAMPGKNEVNALVGHITTKTRLVSLQNEIQCFVP